MYAEQYPNIFFNLKEYCGLCFGKPVVKPNFQKSKSNPNQTQLELTRLEFDQEQKKKNYRLRNPTFKLVRVRTKSCYPFNAGL